ncbi:unnamed protein product [Rotaria sordida]|uniref:CABIT domain-containing protein n=1 Tax=Rotaria sordida TaxID=392033 RepID=A0A818KRT7_9BILA|nr:unnamed protein product [Rotaria sordida]
MYTMLNHYSLSFPSRSDQSYTLKEFLRDIDTECDNPYKLPIIVNITSLNNYGRSIKGLLSKATSLLLIDMCQLDSILAEYHRPSDGRQPFHRSRSILTQRVPTKASTKFLRMKKLSKSLASLTAPNQVSNMSDDEILDNDHDNTYNQRTIIKALNEKRSSSIPLCRIPISYQSFFELLNENDQSIEPCHKLSDLIIIEQDPDDPEKYIEKWPHAFFLRSSCNAYTKKYTSEIFNSTKNYQNSKSTGTTNSSSCGSVTDLESQNNLIELNDNIKILQPGQILTILNVCYGFRRRISDKELKQQQHQQQQQQQQQQPTSPSSSYSSPATWMKEKSKIFFTKKRRQTPNIVNILHESVQSKSIPNTSGPCLKCQTQKGDHFYIFLHESGSFSPLNCQTDDSKLNTEINHPDISSVFQLNEILSNFRFPISVRLLDGLSSYDNINSRAILNRDESSSLTSTKLRLLMPYNENVVFACPLNLLSQKSQKPSSPCIVIPLSVNADIEIQPCTNMSDISKTEAFQKLIEPCFQLIKQYQTEISLINIPLQLTNKTNRRRQPLLKKRSQSDSNLDEVSKDKFLHSKKQPNIIFHSCDDTSSIVSSTYHNRDSVEADERNLSSDGKQRNSAGKISGYCGKVNKNQRRSSFNGYNSEDEIYEDVDKIYDYIRTGDITDDVERIKAKDQAASSSYTNIIIVPNSPSKGTDKQISPPIGSPGKIMKHRFLTQVNNPGTFNQSFETYQSRNDGCVDDDQARALFLAYKQRSKDDSKDFSNVKSTTPMKSMNKH